MQDSMANGTYGPYLAQALTPPMLGSAGMSGYGGMQGIAPQLGNPGFGNPAFSQFGQSSFGPSSSASFYPAGNLMGQQGFGQQLGQPQQVAAQQQQIAATLHQLAHHVAMHSAIGQQVGATLQQLAQYCTQGVVAGQQFAQLLNQLAHQCAWQAQAARTGVGIAPVHGQPFGQPNAWGLNRPFW